MKTIPITQAYTARLVAMPRTQSKLVIATTETFEVIDKKSVRYAEADSNYCRIHCAHHGPVLCTKTLKHIGEKLGHGFMRIHSKYLVNPDLIMRVHRGRPMTIELDNGDKLPVSRSSVTHLMHYLKSNS